MTIGAFILIAPSSSIGPYQIVSLLGKGGMGEVYKARDTRLERIVALKLLPADMLADPERCRRFLHEARTASALNYPHIVTVHDLVSENGVDVLVMEFVSGKSLDELIPKRGLPLNRLLTYSVQIADALAAAHAAGIIHRDLKPGNIMVDDHGSVKLLDFGLAKLTEASETSGPTELTKSLQPETQGGAVFGTAAYMSPEQAEGGPLDARSDIFSFGSVLYEMVTGQRAFAGGSNASVLSGILRDDPKPVSQIVASAPRDLERIVARCLRKDPTRRFQHATDLKLALEELKEDADSGKLDIVTGLQQPAIAALPKRKRIWAAAALLAIPLGGGALWFVRSMAEAPQSPLTALPLTTYPGSQSQPSFSPDGNQVAFAWNGEGRDNWDIYIKLIGTGSPPLRLTTNTATDFAPVWSPDGRFVAFLRRSSMDRAAVMLVPALGGPERKITEIPLRVMASPQLSAIFIRWLSWSPDGNWLLAPDRESADQPLALYLISIETGEKKRLTSPPPG